MHDVRQQRARAVLRQVDGSAQKGWSGPRVRVLPLGLGRQQAQAPTGKDQEGVRAQAEHRRQPAGRVPGAGLIRLWSWFAFQTLLTTLDPFITLEKPSLPRRVLMFLCSERARLAALAWFLVLLGTSKL